MRISLLAAIVSLIIAAPTLAQSKAAINQCSAHYKAENYETAAPYCLTAAQQGDAEAQRRLGYMYNNGKGLAKNEVEAKNWYHKSADQGNAAAQRNLGRMYDLGLGIPKNQVEASRLYLLAAHNGDLPAQVVMGQRYIDGNGVPKNLAESVRWLRLAADAGDAGGQFSLARSYALGIGVAQSEEQADFWIHKSAAGGNDNAKLVIEKVKAAQTLEGVKAMEKGLNRIAKKNITRRNNGLSICQEWQNPVIYVNGNRVVQCRIQSVEEQMEDAQDLVRMITGR